MNICLVEKDIKELELIKPLWEQLNSVHIDKSIYFKNKYEQFTFGKRMEAVYEKSKKGIIKIAMLLDIDNENYIGYCLSSIEDNLGSIESIYIESNYRKFRLGDKLMKNALNWFESNKTADITINVVYSNDEVLLFYECYGFHIGNYILKRN
ncbi:GNAT family N-acetyltransferase [Clostridium lacusfryxellense]|uniref:GNAT family N-acetyltransferase n=1 Tax=Clostridium lacusfryxellense TaxID=205328 RepID=UPI001C0DA33F|nr:GNAT family N-acetyltransferase [Clostridium lacusfryxellense]MBU3113056.1 GNAT family N-acetyltransferase [Clostridium lacusfryxellense]